MVSCQYDSDLTPLDSTRRKNNESEYDLNEFNLKEFYKCVMLNKLKKSMNDNSHNRNDSIANALSDSPRISEDLFRNILLFKRSRLLNKIGGYKAKYSAKMGIAEYLLHSYVILYTPNPVTIYSYEAVFKNLKPDSDEFWTTLRTLTRVQLDVDNFPNQVPQYVSHLIQSGDGKGQSNSPSNEETKKLDRHFTWLCKCCINVTDSKYEVPHDDRSPRSSEKRYSSDANEPSSSSKRSLSAQLMLNNIFNKNYDLSSDVLYEALRQRGNRFVQRSLYNNVKNMGSLCSRGINQKVAAKLTESNARMKRFIDIVQQSSLDSSDPSYNYYDMFGDERRHSSRRAILLRKKYS